MLASQASFLTGRPDDEIKVDMLKISLWCRRRKRHFLLLTFLLAILQKFLIVLVIFERTLTQNLLQGVMSQRLFLQDKFLQGLNEFSFLPDQFLGPLQALIKKFSDLLIDFGLDLI